MNSGKACRRTTGELLQTITVDSSCITFMGKFSSRISDEASVTRKPGDFFLIGPAGRLSIKKPPFISGAGFENTGYLKLIAGNSPDELTR